MQLQIPELLWVLVIPGAMILALLVVLLWVRRGAIDSKADMLKSKALVRVLTFIAIALMAYCTVKAFTDGIKWLKLVIPLTAATTLGVSKLRHLRTMSPPDSPA